jgi:hypothetical protein
MQTYSPKPRPKPIVASPAAKLTYDKPQVATYSPSNGWSNPVGTYYPTTQAYQTTVWNGPANAAATTPAVESSPVTSAATTAAAVTNPRKSADDYAREYKGRDDALAQVDSAFMDQKSMYAAALKKYLEDYTLQGKNVDKDADTAIDGVHINKDRGLTSLNEDFAARGLGRSGLVAKENDNAIQSYDRQESNILTGKKRSHDDLDFRKNKYVGENGENGSNMQTARREAYARLVAKQDLT